MDFLKLLGLCPGCESVEVFGWLLFSSYFVDTCPRVVLCLSRSFPCMIMSGELPNNLCMVAVLLWWNSFLSVYDNLWYVPQVLVDGSVILVVFRSFTS